MDNIPEFDGKLIDMEYSQLLERITSGQLMDWVNSELHAMQTKQPMLYKYITERAKLVSMGASVLNDPHSLFVSTAIETLLLLKIIDASLGKRDELGKFGNMMNTWFKGQEPEGLDTIGK
jgi:hypothetical protein